MHSYCITADLFKILNKCPATQCNTNCNYYTTSLGGKGKPTRNGDIKPKCNQYWTAEEQKKLEELLVQFPPEEVESRRWEKIANCLENRTPLQVYLLFSYYYFQILNY